MQAAAFKTKPVRFPCGYRPTASDANGKPGRREVVHALPLPRSHPFNEDDKQSPLESLVNRAAEQITRFSATEAFSACAADGVIIDIRSQDTRERYGLIPGSLHIPRTVLEWRIALESPWRNLHLGGFEQRLILICDHGYSSTLAASNLVQLGFYRAGDVIGGFDSWKNNGLPIAPCRHQISTASALPGTGPPQ